MGLLRRQWRWQAEVIRLVVDGHNFSTIRISRKILPTLATLDAGL